MVCSQKSLNKQPLKTAGLYTKHQFLQGSDCMHLWCHWCWMCFPPPKLSLQPQKCYLARYILLRACLHSYSGMEGPLNVSSLYTNIPTEDGIYAALQGIENWENKDTLCPPTSWLKKLLELILYKNVFRFNDKFYTGHILANTRPQLGDGDCSISCKKDSHLTALIYFVYTVASPR